MSKPLCWHTYGDCVEGYKTCNRCGKKVKLHCNHQKWLTISKTKISNNAVGLIGYLYVQKCIHCGLTRTEKVNLK